MSEFPFVETRLAAAAGLPPKALRAAREKMRRGLDWDVCDKKTVLSVSGFYGVLKALGVPLEGLDVESLQAEARAAQGEACLGVVMGVVERFLMNRLMLGVRLPDQRLVNLRIPRGRELFKKRMAVPVRPAAGRPYWVLARDLPRRPGRW